MLSLLLATLVSTASAAPTGIVGSTYADVYPPASTTVDRGLFPDRLVVGYPHVTRTGAQPYAFVTTPAEQFPRVQQPFGPVVLPEAKSGKGGKGKDKGGDGGGGKGEEKDKDKGKEKGNGKGKKKDKNRSPIYDWGYLSPRYSLPSDYFGAHEDSSPIVPGHCHLDAVHLPFRHGARYPTAGDNAEKLATRLLNASQAGHFKASGELSFLNDWTYKLGSDILVPFGRQQLYELGVRSRIAYGHLLNEFTERGELPVFRTGSIDRMVETMEAFGQGFFGRDSQDQFSMSIAIEAEGINATVYPGGGTCPNSDLDVAASKFGMAEFINHTMAGTAKRLQRSLKGYEIQPGDVHTMMALCAYETLALGYSAFCPLFTEDDFLNFQYAWDIMFFYGNGPGGQTTAAQGKGWVQEFLARLTHTPIEVYDSSTNSTLDGNPETFPLNQSIYADASHDSYIMSTFTALNLPIHQGALGLDKRVDGRVFTSSALVPFNTNFVAQVMTCQGEERQQIRFLINDAVVPLSGTYDGCEEDEHGLCALDAVVEALQRRMKEIDYTSACRGNITMINDTAQLKDSNGMPYEWSAQ